jgi:DNA-binding XRE family transcriptional regulator
MTQEQLPEELDLAVLTIQSIEQGWRYPSLPILFYLCKVMEIPIQFF